MQTHIKKVVSDWHGILAVVPVVSFFIIAVRSFGWMQPMELAALDLFFKTRPLEPADERIVIVGVTERDIENMGGWPTNDWILARSIDKIKVQQPTAIGLDIYRNRSISPGKQNLERVFRTTPNLIGVEKVVTPPIPPSSILKSLNQSSSNDVMLDPDGVLRRAILFPIPGQNIQTLGLAVSLIYLQSQKVSPQVAENGSLRLGATIFKPFESGDGGYVSADAGGYQLLLNFRGNSRSFTTVSLTDVLHERVPKTLFRDRVVLVGSLAPSLNDVFFTPYSKNSGASPVRTSGVEIQANLASQIISSVLDRRPAIQTGNDFLENFGIVVSSAIVATLTWMWNGRNRSSATIRFLFTTGAIACAGVTCVVLGSYALFLGGYWFPVIPTLIAVFATALYSIAYTTAGRLQKASNESSILRSQLDSTRLELEVKSALDNSQQKEPGSSSRNADVPAEMEVGRQRLKERYRQKRET